MKVIVNGSNNKKMIVKLTYFGAEFEMEYDTLNCFYGCCSPPMREQHP